jgi:hypothetical protein
MIELLFNTRVTLNVVARTSSLAPTIFRPSDNLGGSS